LNRSAASALAFRDHRILGYRMEPFSAAHAVALEVCGLNADGLTNPVQIVTALRICSRPIGRDCRPSNYLRPNGLRELAALVAMAIPGRFRRVRKQFADYLADFLSCPDIRLPEGRVNSEINGDPQLSRIDLGMKAGLTEHRAWSMPVAWLDWTIAQHVANDGGALKIIDSEREAERVARLKTLKAK